ncbi:PD-(D/E)XK nuclease family protein [Burkholderia sp. Se-20373]|uniref:PDDEXK-like family protein n=1 Tax=Burkholderia sp. Se-20373 TaxID=2703898 RepID=UPI00197E0EE6|nr:PD-(D/E)XK nuclease family protein [Burkholderia sp. Se-20373]MBN3748534.1 PD-(D/E)XK nuclease family protein [Burkholderia sp. Se-20373]
MPARSSGTEGKYSHEAFQKFISDQDTGKAIEALKRANDVFDIIAPSETQHSQMLQWLLNPREGHGQGDALLKDFLIAAWQSAEEAEFAGRARSRAFFDYWTPARISMTGFHGAIVLREFAIGETKESRLDILILDAQNRMMVVVENKYKAIHTEGQLAAYREAATQMCKGVAFRGWTVAFIALDKGRSWGVESDEWHQWVYLDYSWLEAGANRAETQMRRGNQSASLVVSYCQRQQADYKSREERDLDAALARLMRSHAPVLDKLAQMYSEQLGRGVRLRLRDEQDQLWMFGQHYPELVKRVSRLRNLSFVQTDFDRLFAGQTTFTYTVKDTYIDIFDNSWERFCQEPDERNFIYWPVHLRAIRVDDKAAEQGRLNKNAESADSSVVLEEKKGKSYRVFVWYTERRINGGYAARVRKAMRMQYGEDADWRESGVNRKLGRDVVGEDSLVRALKQRYEVLERALGNC